MADKKCSLSRPIQSPIPKIYLIDQRYGTDVQLDAALLVDCNEMPCIPALFLMADSVRRKAMEINCSEAPFAASSRRRVRSSRDHKLVGLDRRLLNEGMKDRSVCIETPG
jgi:hypothetical protein